MNARYRLVVGAPDETDSTEVYQWMYAVCRDAPLRELARQFGTSPSEEPIAVAVGRRFPPTTVEAALKGVRAGFTERRK